MPTEAPEEEDKEDEDEEEYEPKVMPTEPPEEEDEDEKEYEPEVMPTNCTPLALRVPANPRHPNPLALRSTCKPEAPKPTCTKGTCKPETPAPTLAPEVPDEKEYDVEVMPTEAPEVPEEKEYEAKVMPTAAPTCTKSKGACKPEIPAPTFAPEVPDERKYEPEVMPTYTPAPTLAPGKTTDDDEYDLATATPTPTSAPKKTGEYKEEDISSGASSMALSGSHGKGKPAPSGAFTHRIREDGEIFSGEEGRETSSDTTPLASVAGSIRMRSTDSDRSVRATPKKARDASPPPQDDLWVVVKNLSQQVAAQQAELDALRNALALHRRQQPTWRKSLAT
ncbi:hypothetical protein BASA83_005360 [Batrachochytrium salamandrivorans]|nr:hypothetical protein BASA83_005360 [Batrachochytrium salamandrivorans]